MRTVRSFVSLAVIQAAVFGSATSLLTLGGCPMEIAPIPVERAAEVGAAGAKDASRAGGNLVEVCHIPPGNPENAHTILVAPSAVAAHLAHGDYLGPCECGSGSMVGCELFVCDYGNDQIRRFDGLTGDLIPPPISCSNPANPAGMTLGPDGKIYLCSTLDNRILCYDVEADQCTEFACGTPLNAPISLTFGPDALNPNDAEDDLYVVNYLPDYQVVRYDWPSGEVADPDFLVDDPNDPNDLPASPIDLVFGPDANLYITSTYENTDCVKRYDGTTGEYVDDFVRSGAGGLDHPNGLRFGRDGSLYVVSGLTNQVLRYDGGTGDFIDVCASDGLDAPRYLVFGPDCNLYVTNLYADNVTYYDGTTCEFIGVFASGGLAEPTGLVFRCAD